jgi:hypothetical protein
MTYPFKIIGLLPVFVLFNEKTEVISSMVLTTITAALMVYFAPWMTPLIGNLHGGYLNTN